MNVKFCSLTLLGFIYGPIKLLTKMIAPKTNPINILVISKRPESLLLHSSEPYCLFIVRIILSSLTISCWRFLQKRISFNFGSRVAFFFFLSEIFNWNSLNQSSRFIEDNLVRAIGKTNSFYGIGLIFSFIMFWTCN